VCGRSNTLTSHRNTVIGIESQIFALDTIRRNKEDFRPNKNEG
jgi:hypothetical protein